MRIKSIVVQEVSKTPDETSKAEAVGDEEGVVAREQVRVVYSSLAFSVPQAERKPLRPSSTLYEGDDSHLIEVAFVDRAFRIHKHSRSSTVPCSRQCVLSRWAVLTEEQPKKHRSN
jgi:hypothetical protein